MVYRIVLGMVLSFSGLAMGAVPSEYSTLKEQAEKFYVERSFALANETYRKADALELPAAEKRWVAFRLADSQWRSAASTENPDTTKLDDARRKLEVLVRDITRVEERDRVWVEVQESLADFHWTRRHNQNWGAAWPLYQQVLEWWAGAPDIELARTRYLQVVWRTAQPPQIEPYYYYGYWGNYIPMDVLENTLEIAKSNTDKAHAHYLLAMTLRQQGEWEQRARVADEFAAAMSSGKTNDWYDDALYNYAEWMMNQGRIVPLSEGNWRTEPDYVTALELFRRFTTEFGQGESRYWDQARQQIKNITDPQVGLSVPNVFLPGSELQYFLTWRNVKQIELALYPIEINRDVNLNKNGEWLQSIDLSKLEKIKGWSRSTGDSGEYKPGNETLRLEEKLKPGAYLLAANAGGKTAREVILISDATLVLKASGKRALVYFCNALDSEPLGGAKLKLWERWYDGQQWHVHEAEKVADKDGIGLFQLTRPGHHSLELFASAILQDRQAYSVGRNYWYGREEEPWRIYAFTDRPAYRPKETVQWKFVARRYNGSVYSTPSDQVIEYRIDDPRGTKIKEDKIKLNAFGSAWGSVDLLETMPLGEYRVTFWDEGQRRSIGNATLFRLEEYKLPEFKVTVTTPEEDGRKKSFKTGERVEASIQADYYFGGPVMNASVEIVVYQNPFYHSWQPKRDFPWLYEDIDSGEGRWRRWYGGEGQIIKRETVKTDLTGKASIAFDTPRGAAQDFEYRIQARVTDSSRREIVGNGTVRVTRQRYYVYPQPDHNLYRPQDKVRVEFNAIDANEQPVVTDATVKITRDYWYEIWLDPAGKEVKGDELKRLRSASAIFPPLPSPGQPGWRLKFRGYQHDEILSKSLKTDTNGVAELSFTPEREGYYRLGWTSEDRTTRSSTAITNIIRAETTVWVATGTTTELGYRHGGVEIIVDKDTFRTGQNAPIMLVAPTSDRHVLFTVEGEDLYSYQLVHLEGTVKLIELPIEEKHVPNIFLSATLVNDRQVFVDAKQVIVPPTKNFLTIDLRPDRLQYRPQEEGLWTVTTRDDRGNPVPAELALSLVDESVFYIQQDYAGDPRQFYFGTKRQQVVQTQTTMNQKSYARLVPGAKEELIDDREMERRDQARSAGAVEELSIVNGLADTDKLSSFDSYSVTALGGAGGGGTGGAQELSRSRRLGALNAPASASVAALAKKEYKAKEPADAPAPEEPVQVRTDFRSTILWRPDLVTDKSGTATIKVKYPDSLTGWKATARAVSSGNQFGTAEAGTRTKMPLMVRLQAPRFFVVGDSVTISAVVNNNTDEPMDVRLALDVAGGVEPKKDAGKAQTIQVPANAEKRFDWLAEVKKPGEVKLKVTGRAEKYADAMEKTYLAHEHGLEKLIARSGKARGNDLLVRLDLPKARKLDSTMLTVQVTPSMAVTMLDALPYLIAYPYGCTEQTMSRFLPAAITAKTLKDLGLNAEDVMGRLFGGIEPAHAAATHSRGKKDLAELDQIIRAGLDRLYDFQHEDGGWGWWKEGSSDHWMSAYVVWGLALARDGGALLRTNVPPARSDPATGLPVANGSDDALAIGAQYLDKRLVEEEANPDMQAWMLHALAVYNGKQAKPTAFQQKAFENLWTNREKLNAYTRALLALAAHHFDKTDEALTLVRNLENGVKRDDRPDTSVLIDNASASTTVGTAHWGEDGIYWRWSEGGVEATAFALRALLTIDPQNKLVEPVTNWLIKNRRGAQWNSTRDTAIVVLAMNDYLRASGELKPELEYELVVNGTSIARKKISGADVFNAPSRFPIEARLVKDSNEIRIRRKAGNGPIYFAAEARFVSLEEPVTPAGNEIFVKREYYKLVGRPTLLKGYVYDRQPLKSGETVRSGERVETLVTIEAKNNYEYLIFEDLKPAGFEAVEVRSGEPLYAKELKSGAPKLASSAPVEGKAHTSRKADRRVKEAVIKIANPAPTPDETDFTGRTQWVYRELRDRKVALFIDKLPEGVWEIRYDFRAEVPGNFHALPVVGYAMYVPEIRANGAESRIEVLEGSQ